MKIIDLTQGIGCLVDDEDFVALNQFSWYASWRSREWVACRTIRLPGNKFRQLLMHQIILPVPAELLVDHRKHHDFWVDNRKSNLRVASRRENCQNSRKYLCGNNRFKGVSWKASRGLWRAYISYDKVQCHLGYYESEEDAAHVYDYAARAYFGEFACLNFP